MYINKYEIQRRRGCCYFILNVKEMKCNGCCCYLLDFVVFLFVWDFESSKEVVAEDEELSEVAMVVSVMNSVVLCSHDRFGVTPDSVVDVGRPYPREEQQKHVSEVVNRN